MSAAPGWYPDPSSKRPSTLRYFDGATWSGYVAITAPVPMAHLWKGSQLGQPASGEAITTARWGRSPGKAVTDIRPVCVDGWSLAGDVRPHLAYPLARMPSVLWLLDVLWRVRDENSQRLYDKLCDTIVVND